MKLENQKTLYGGNWVKQRSQRNKLVPNQQQICVEPNQPTARQPAKLNRRIRTMATEQKGPEMEEVREQDRFLPIANISRIMKKVLPPNAKIAKDAKEMVQECVSEFISFITGEASDKCLAEKRKTINGDDLLWAMSTLGFDKYVEPLKTYLEKYRETVKDDKPDKSAKAEQAVAGSNMGGGMQGVQGMPQQQMYMSGQQQQVRNPNAATMALARLLVRYCHARSTTKRRPCDPSDPLA